MYYRQVDVANGLGCGSEADLLSASIGLRLCLGFQPPCERSRVSLAEDAGFPRDDREIRRRQAIEPEDERGSLGAERATIGLADLLLSHRQEADLEQEPPRRRRV